MPETPRQHGHERSTIPERSMDYRLSPTGTQHVYFDMPDTMFCWAHSEACRDGGPIGCIGNAYLHACNQRSTNDLGLCERHYEEIIGKGQ